MLQRILQRFRDSRQEIGEPVTSLGDERAEEIDRIWQALQADNLQEVDRLLATAVERPFSPEEDAHVDGCIAGLSGQHQKYLQLHLQGLSNEKIAAETGTSVRAVRRALTAVYGEMTLGLMR